MGLKLRKVKKKLLSLTIDFYKREAGQIISVKDGVARVNGLFGVLSGEMVFMGLFKIQGMVLSLERNTVSVVIFGNDIIAGPKVVTKFKRKVDTKAIGIIPRQSVREPMQTGVSAIDAITPIGCGQRELIIGDRQTGKTTIAVDTILNQKKSGYLYCIYVAIGQIVQFLKKSDSLHNTIIVSATSSEPATLQFL